MEIRVETRPLFHWGITGLGEQEVSTWFVVLNLLCFCGLVAKPFLVPRWFAEWIKPALQGLVGLLFGQIKAIGDPACGLEKRLITTASGNAWWTVGQIRLDPFGQFRRYVPPGGLLFCRRFWQPGQFEIGGPENLIKGLLVRLCAVVAV